MLSNPTELPSVNPMVFASMYDIEPFEKISIPLDTRRMAMAFALVRALTSLPIVDGKHQQVVSGIDRVVSDIFAHQSNRWREVFDLKIYDVVPGINRMPYDTTWYFEGLNHGPFRNAWERVLMSDYSGGVVEPIRAFANPLVEAIERRVYENIRKSGGSNPFVAVLTDDAFKGVARVDFKLEVPFQPGKTKVNA